MSLPLLKLLAVSSDRRRLRSLVLLSVFTRLSGTLDTHQCDCEAKISRARRLAESAGLPGGGAIIADAMIDVGQNLNLGQMPPIQAELGDSAPGTTSEHVQQYGASSGLPTGGQTAQTFAPTHWKTVTATTAATTLAMTSTTSGGAFIAVGGNSQPGSLSSEAGGSLADSREETELLLPCKALADLAGSNSRQSPIAIYVNEFKAWLYGSSAQWTIAFASLAVGVVALRGGPWLWEVLFTLAMAATAGSVTSYELQTQGHDFGHVTDVLMAAEVAAAISLATHFGFEGSQVLFGAVLGLAGGFRSVGSLSVIAGHATPGLALCWNSLGAVLGVCATTVWRTALLTTTTPLLGAFLTVSGSGSLISAIWHACTSAGASHPSDADGDASGGSAHSGNHSVPPALPPPGMPWASAAGALLGPGSPEIALLWNVMCIMLATAVHAADRDRRLPAVMCLVGCICTNVGVIAVHQHDWHQPGTPDDGSWQWPACGCALWAVLASSAAWRQLGILSVWEASGFWRGYWNSAGAKLRKLTGPTYVVAGRDDHADQERGYVSLPAPPGAWIPATTGQPGQPQQRAQQLYATVPVQPPGNTIDDGSGPSVQDAFTTTLPPAPSANSNGL